MLPGCLLLAFQDADDQGRWIKLSLTTQSGCLSVDETSQDWRHRQNWAASDWPVTGPSMTRDRGIG